MTVAAAAYSLAANAVSVQVRERDVYDVVITHCPECVQFTVVRDCRVTHRRVFHRTQEGNGRP